LSVLVDRPALKENWLMRNVLMAVWLMTAAPVVMAGQPATVDVGTIGPQAGQEVPAFDLIDQGGTRHTRESILGPNGAMLLFFRSADW
jgi:hypothetical protein